VVYTVENNNLKFQYIPIGSPQKTKTGRAVFCDKKYDGDSMGYPR